MTADGESMARVRVTYRRDDSDWWVGQAAAHAAAHTQGRTLEQVRTRMVEAVDVALGAPHELDEVVVLPPAIEAEIRHAREARRRALAAIRLAQQKSAEAGRLATDAGLSLRDVGTLLGMTR
jgi:predicted RNase H-like HicB family nuclease